MSKKFHSHIKGTGKILSEFQGLFGVPDFIIMQEGEKPVIVAIELKLKNWKQALKQAFRYKNFSHKSFVIMDEKGINPALNNIETFIKFNIGLASFVKGKGVCIYYHPSEQEPFCPNSTKLVEESTQKMKSKHVTAHLF